MTTLRVLLLVAAVPFAIMSIWHMIFDAFFMPGEKPKRKLSILQKLLVAAFLGLDVAYAYPQPGALEPDAFIALFICGAITAFRIGSDFADSSDSRTFKGVFRHLLDGAANFGVRLQLVSPAVGSTKIK